MKSWHIFKRRLAEACKALLAWLTAEAEVLPHTRIVFPPIMEDAVSTPTHQEMLERPGKYDVVAATEGENQFISVKVNGAEVVTVYGADVVTTAFVYGLAGDVITVEGAPEVSVRRVEYADTEK